jgi:hypothetical protein
MSAAVAFVGSPGMGVEATWASAVVQIWAAAAAYAASTVAAAELDVDTEPEEVEEEDDEAAPPLLVDDVELLPQAASSAATPAATPRATLGNLGIRRSPFSRAALRRAGTALIASARRVAEPGFLRARRQ